ncbi:hypothetical protein, partial [uncultured Flavobacterium sp.]|uniref:hypothetical protein n=1 Tax=uncultured Flavobacterium sp. TaxID=165435 RepID=UPI0025E500ED
MDINQQKEFIKTLSGKSDRELLEIKTYYQWCMAKDSERTRNNALYIFLLLLVSAIGTALFMFQILHEASKASH